MMKPTPKRYIYIGGLALALAVIPAGCTAVSLSPPLTSQLSQGQLDSRHHVPLSSGRFQRPYRVIGVFQMTQEGYKWFHEVEVVEDANPSSILYRVGVLAREHGADGVQHLELVDMDPQTPGEKAKKQFDSSVRIAKAVDQGRPGDIAKEGTKTRWEVRGELVVFTD